MKNDIFVFEKTPTNEAIKTSVLFVIPVLLRNIQSCTNYIACIGGAQLNTHSLQQKLQTEKHCSRADVIIVRTAATLQIFKFPVLITVASSVQPLRKT